QPALFFRELGHREMGLWPVRAAYRLGNADERRVAHAAAQGRALRRMRSLFRGPGQARADVREPGFIAGARGFAAGALGRAPRGDSAERVRAARAGLAHGVTRLA